MALASKSSVKLFPCLLAVASTLAAQPPKIAVIDYYGIHKVSHEKIEKALRVKPGDPLPASKGAVEDALDRIPGVVRSRLEAVCCEGSGAILFVGIEERGAPAFPFRSAPSGSELLDEEIVDTYHQFRTALDRAVRENRAAEDLRSGHSLVADPDARALQEKFATFAAAGLPQIREVLRNSADDDHRAIAAYVIGYAPDKREVINDLLFAIQDPISSVRSNAMRALTAIAVYAALNPNLKIKISPTWFVEMLNSIVLSDRQKAVMALLGLTDTRSPEVLDLIRGRALSSVVEMARWNSLEHAIAPFTLVGRMAGLSEQEIQDKWSKGERETVISAFLKQANSKNRAR
jgi:hypothetical protein